MAGLAAWRGITAAALLFALAGCFFNHGQNLPRAADALERSALEPPRPERFTLCRDHGCMSERPVSLGAGAWAEIIAPLRSAAATPAEERRQVAEAVGRFERAAGPQAGTAADVGGTLTGYGAGGQQDCVDEAVNTTRFLQMLDKAGLLRHHEVGTPVHRAWIPDELTHLTAVLVEDGSRRDYAIDSWFHGNGHAAEVVDIEAWLEGWQPAVWHFEAAALQDRQPKLASDGKAQATTPAR